MSAAVNVASALLALIPAATGDQPNLSSMNVNARGTIATGTLDAREAGRLIPRQIPGMSAWVCGPAVKAGRRVRCTFDTASHVWKAALTYRADGGHSYTTVTVRIIARTGGAR